jgi:hypothetical protein
MRMIFRGIPLETAFRSAGTAARLSRKIPTGQKG